jgi:uncharacterized protein (DUF1786 family)
MSLSKGSVNPLNVLEARRLTFIPKHFTRMRFTDEIWTEKIDVWVYQNLDSRYAIVKSLQLDSNNKMVEIVELGVEDAKELTILSLSCPHLVK